MMNKTENRREIEACRKALHTLDSASEGWNDALRRLRRITPYPSGCCPLCGRPVSSGSKKKEEDFNWAYNSRMCGPCDIWLQKADPDRPGRPVRPSQAWEESRDVPDELVYRYQGKTILRRKVPRMKVEEAFTMNWNDLLHEAGVPVPEKPIVHSGRRLLRVPAGVPPMEEVRALWAGSEEWEEKMEQAWAHTTHGKGRCPFCGKRAGHAPWLGTAYCPSCNLWLGSELSFMTPMEFVRREMIRVNIPADGQPKIAVFDSRWEEEGWKVKKPGTKK